MRLSARVPAILLTAAGASFLAYKVKQQPQLFSSFFSSTPSVNSTSATPLANMPRAPVIALSHGGGPMPVLGDPSHSDLVESMRIKVPAILGLNDTERRPKAIVLVTAHWSENVPSISSGAKPKLLYDYGGFPPEAYRLKYDAPGSPEIAQRVSDLLSQKGFKPDLDDERGWDHGVFVPMLLVHPAADIPVVQVSVLASEDPAAHFKMGQALAPLRDDNIAIVGSGFASFHNLRLMFAGITRDPAAAAQLKEWNAAVTAAATEPDEKARLAAFEQWRNFPAAYVTHPRGGAEHFLPLIVCAGAVGDEQGKTYTDHFQGLDILSYYWE